VREEGREGRAVLIMWPKIERKEVQDDTSRIIRINFAYQYSLTRVFSSSL